LAGGRLGLLSLRDNGGDLILTPQLGPPELLFEPSLLFLDIDHALELGSELSVLVVIVVPLSSGLQELSLYVVLFVNLSLEVGLSVFNPFDLILPFLLRGEDTAGSEFVSLFEFLVEQPLGILLGRLLFQLETVSESGGLNLCSFGNGLVPL